MYTGRAAATINRPVPFLALNSASVLLLIASFAVSRAAYDCGGSKRGGPTLFSRDHGVSSEEASGIVIFQCGNSTPAALTAVNTSAFATASSIPIADLSVLINAAYAARHGYRYEFHLFPTDARCTPAWCRLFAMERVLSTSPLAALHLDLDVYIKTDLPLSLTHLHNTSRSRYITMDEYHEHPYQRQNRTWHSYTIYDRLTEFVAPQRVPAVPGLSRDMPMPELQALFETHPSFSGRMYTDDMLNTGAAWLELGHPQGSHKGHLTQSLLHEWWALGRLFDGGKYLLHRMQEQRLLSVVMATRAELRAHTALLEDNVYNSPVSECIPHLYAEYKRVNSYVAEALRTFRERSVAFLDRLPMRVVAHTQYEMSPPPGQ